MRGRFVVLPHLKWLFTPWIFLGVAMYIIASEVFMWVWDHFALYYKEGDLPATLTTGFILLIVTACTALFQYYLYIVTNKRVISTTEKINEDSEVHNGEGI